MLSRRSMASAVSALTVSLALCWAHRDPGPAAQIARSRPEPTNDEFGVEITLPEKTIVYLQRHRHLGHRL